MATPNALNIVGIGATGSPISSDGTATPIYRNLAQYVYLVDDFICSTGTGGIIGDLSWSRIAQNAGDLTFSTANTDAARPGIISLDTGTNTNGVGGVFLGATPLLFGGGRMIINFWKKLSALSNGTDTYNVILGFGDNGNGGVPSDSR